MTSEPTTAAASDRVTIAIATFPRFTALDAIGPYEVLQRVPHFDVVFVGHSEGVVRSDNGMLGLSWWAWLSGPSVALSVIIMLVIWTTAGTFMLMFLAALQDLPLEVEEAARIDGAGRWGVFRNVTLPHLKPTMLLVTTLGLIGTWQVFDQVYVMTQGGPGKSTLTPAYLSYSYAFDNQKWGIAAAMAFVLFLIIFAMTSFQRFLFRDKDAIATRRAEKRTKGDRARATAGGAA